MKPEIVYISVPRAEPLIQVIYFYYKDIQYKKQKEMTQQALIVTE